MKNEYFDSLHDIEMSEERKSELIDVLAKEIEANNMTNIIEMPAKAGKKKRARAPFRFAAALVACMVAGSGAAFCLSSAAFTMAFLGLARWLMRMRDVRA